MDSTHSHFGKKLTFIHLSDIHFVRNFSGQSAYDIDDIVRNELLRDAKRLHAKLGDINGIIVTGDIAFAGKPEEYETALKWLSDLADALGCERGYIWCVPGNHDVDQSVLKLHTTLLPTHEEIRHSSDLDDRLRAHLESESTGALMFASLVSYNEKFAGRVGCVTTHKQPWWEDDLRLNDGTILRLWGLNSVIISSQNDHRDTSKLCLGSAQTEFKREDGVEYMTLCHHPPDWLVDGENARVALRAYSKIQLFGHKHMHDVEEVNGTLWLCAGAVHPVRKEKEWIPTYYFLSIEVEKKGDKRFLAVDVYRRVWDKTPREFVRPAGQHADSHHYALPISDLEGTAQRVSPERTVEVKVMVDQSGMTLNRKKLLYSFVGLPYHTRISIMQKLGLIDEANRNLPDSELFATCFDRAVSKGLLEQIWDAVESHRTAKSE